MCRGASPLMMVSREQLLGIRTSISIAPPATRVAHRPSFYRTVAHVYLCESLFFWIGRFWHWSIAAVFATRLLRSIQWTWQSSRSPPVPFFCSRLQLRSSPRRTALSRTPGGSSNGIAGSGVSLSYRHCLLWLSENSCVLVGIRQRQLLQPGPPPKSTSKQNLPEVINL